MGWLVRHDGSVDQVRPANKTEFTSEELRVLIGGYAEFVRFTVRPACGSWSLNQDALFALKRAHIGEVSYHVPPELPISRNTIMIVDEEGRLKNRPMNAIGSLLYGTLQHGQPIVGDIILVEPREIGE